MSHNDMRIRRAALNDIETIVRFNCALAKESEHETLEAGVVAAGVRRALEDEGRGIYYLAEVEGAVAGQTMFTLEWSDWRDGWFWWIQSVYVDRPFRCRGVFRALYEHIRSLARQRSDVRGLRLYVHRENAHAMETYRRLGMVQTDYLLYEEAWSG